MRRITSILKWIAIGLVVMVAGALGWLFVAPPDLIRVGAGYTAKIVCSSVFVGGRDPSDVLEVDVQAPGHPLLKLMKIDVDRVAGTVSAGLFGVIGNGRAVARPGTGCAKVPDGDVVAARRFGAVPPPAAGALGLDSRDGQWPEGDAVEAPADALAPILDDDTLAGQGMRAIVVVKGGRIVAERYGPGFNRGTPLLGWSMTKTVTAALIGTLVADGKLTLDKSSLFPGWQGDERADITVADLMGMSSGLSFNEDYGDVTDVTRMLFLEPDMAEFAATRPLAGPVAGTFNYSSGTSLLLSRIWQEAAGDRVAALDWPRARLFEPLGMDSAVLETDAAGTFVGSSYLYATARDWARFGLFLLRDGVWNGEQVLPAGYVSMMREPAPASSGRYGKGQLWLHGPGGGPEIDAGFDLPDDAYWLLGHDGQAMAIIPSLDLIVLRMGLTPRKLEYRVQALVEATIDALE